MDMDMLEYYRMVKRGSLDFIYSGPIWAEGIEGLSEIVKKRIDFDEVPLSTSTSVFSVFVEQVNNMLMYSADKENHESQKGNHTNVSKGVLVICSKERTYTLQSGNVMDAGSVELVKRRIDHLNTLDKGSLRKLYMEQLKSEDPNPGSRGGGIGLTEIARRAAAPIEYEFKPYDEGRVFFSMSVKVGG